MQVSYFETGRYYAPSNLPREWPMPPGAYDREAGLRAFHGMVERSRRVEELAPIRRGRGKSHAGLLFTVTNRFQPLGRA